MLDFILLSPLKQYSSFGLLLLRLTTGAFLIWGMWDIAFDAARIHDFARYLGRYGFPVPDFMARVSVYAQLAAGIGLLAGLCTRWAGILCGVNFAVALIMVDRFAGIRGALPAACLTAIGVFVAFHGAGRFGLDAFLESGAETARRPGRRRGY